MQNNNKKKICVVTSSLAYGGAEKSSATLTNVLHDLGYDVHVVTVLSTIEYSYSGTLFNLGLLKNKKDTFLGRIERFKVFKTYLKEHNFDCIIDNRSRVQAYREFIITKFLYKNYSVIYVLHNYIKEKTFTPYRWLNTLLYKNKRFTAVSKEIKEKVEKEFKLKDITTIYNAFDFQQIHKKSLQNINFPNEKANYIIYYGRIDDSHKNLVLLLDAYKASKLPEEGIKLMILGDGDDFNRIVNYAKEIRINDFIVFKGFTANPYPYVKKALFTMLTSRHEGFPMVIPESLSLETPVVSVDCKSGPKEVIVHKENGLLVKNYNANALAEAMNSFIFDKKLYLYCKANTKSSVKKFSKENIAQNWKNIIESLDEY